MNFSYMYFFSVFFFLRTLYLKQLGVGFKSTTILLNFDFYAELLLDLHNSSTKRCRSSIEGRLVGFLGRTAKTDMTLLVLLLGSGQSKWNISASQIIKQTIFKHEKYTKIQSLKSYLVNLNYKLSQFIKMKLSNYCVVHSLVFASL